MRLTRRARNILLSIHVATTVSVLGADLVLVALLLSGLTGSDPLTIYPAARLVGSSIVAPLALVSLAAGVLLALLSSYGVRRYWWVATKLTVAVGLTIVVFLVLVPGLTAAAETATSAAELTEANRLTLALGPVVGSSLLFVNIVLAVYKPAWRLRRSAREPSAAPDPIGQTRTAR